MFSQTVEYALRAAVFLAQQRPKPCTTMEIAERTLQPQAYLAKILLGLGRAGILHSQRGLHGGFILAKDAAEISVLEIVNAVEPIQRIRNCPLGLKSHRAGLCRLHEKLDSALALVETAFSTTTLATLIETPNGVSPLCESPSEALPIISIGRTAVGSTSLPVAKRGQKARREKFSKIRK